MNCEGPSVYRSDPFFPRARQFEGRAARSNLCGGEFKVASHGAARRACCGGRTIPKPLREIEFWREHHQRARRLPRGIWRVDATGAFPFESRARVHHEFDANEVSDAGSRTCRCSEMDEIDATLRALVAASRQLPHSHEQFSLGENGRTPRQGFGGRARRVTAIAGANSKNACSEAQHEWKSEHVKSLVDGSPRKAQVWCLARASPPRVCG